MRESLRQLHAAPAVGVEFEGTRHQLVGLAAGLEHFDLVRVPLAVPFLEFRLRVEQVHLAGPAVLHQLDYRAGFSREVDWLRKYVRAEFGTTLRVQEVGES